MARLTEAELAEEQKLIAAAKLDRAAFAALYERYVDQIYAYVYTLTKNREQAEDVTAATFAKGMEELPKFEWRQVPYSAWLYRVASNLVARSKRKPGWVELSGDILADGPDPAETASSNLRAWELRDVVTKVLPSDQRQAVVLRYGADLSNREIAKIMGRSEGAIKLLTFRALTALRKHLGAPLPAQRSEKTNG